MQCIRAFFAQQPDELSLEKADVILVHQESSDSKIISLLSLSFPTRNAYKYLKKSLMLDSILFFPDWVEGTKLSDRQRGWVPKSHLETIASSRIKNHNLSDALKLTAATATAWPESGHYKGSNSVIWFRNCWIKDDGHSVTFLEDNAAAQNAIRLHLSVAVALVCFMCWNNVFILLHEAAKWTAEDCQKGGVGIMVFICYAQYITNIVCTSVDLCF